MIRLSLLIVSLWLCHGDETVNPDSGSAEPKKGPAFVLPPIFPGQYSN